jgi:CPA2 family monovalent cation:H+ antiporter-2
VLRESQFSARAAEQTLPLQDAFAVLFFVSVGMLFDPQVILDKPLHLLATVAVIVVGKGLAAVGVVLILRYPIRTAVVVAASLAQVGEFSFILAGLGMSLGLLPREGNDLILAGALVSIALNPLVFSLVGPLERWFSRHPRLSARLEPSNNPLAELPMSTDAKYLSNQVVLVGWGRVGKHIASELSQRGVPFVVADSNRELVESLRREGVPAVWGDATDPAVLIQAHIRDARALAIATPDTVQVRTMVETARALNEGIQVVVRSHNLEEAELLEREGSGKVFVGEIELARSMVQFVLKVVGPRT